MAEGLRTIDNGWRVPTDYTDIQAALDAVASDGEVICVEAGTYAQTIEFPEWDVALAGTEGPDHTLIDGDGQGPVVTIDRAQTSATELRGFTITGGNDSFPWTIAPFG